MNISGTQSDKPDDRKTARPTPRRRCPHRADRLAVAPADGRLPGVVSRHAEHRPPERARRPRAPRTPVDDAARQGHGRVRGQRDRHRDPDGEARRRPASPRRGRPSGRPRGDHQGRDEGLERHGEAPQRAAAQGPRRPHRRGAGQLPVRPARARRGTDAPHSTRQTEAARRRPQGGPRTTPDDRRSSGPTCGRTGPSSSS